ncbi:maleamate amidohydrolase [Paraburkholderia sp. GAS448]|uniref:isochorismatase family protein n=1 Tax=Paraburkholderia sp. GAS448 TaxID=3035136 RepID=UPI003D1D4C95
MSTRSQADVLALYAERGLGGALEAGGRPAVIVVDLIYGFTDPTFPAGGNLDQVVDSTLTLLDRAREAGVPVIYTTIAWTKPMQANSVWLRKMPAMLGLIEGSRWVEVDARLKSTEDEVVITKRGASAFSGTDLANQLTALGIDTLIVCGATTSGCVRATVVDGCMLGYTCLVPRECVGDRAVEPHEANLFDIQAKYGDVIDLDGALKVVSAARGAA